MLFKNRIISYSKRFNYINTTVIIILSSAIVYFLHRISNGAILTSKLLTFFTFVSFLCIFTLPCWPWMKLTLKRRRENIWIFVSLFSILLVIWSWGGETGFSGDYKKFKMFSMQQQNGFTKPHFFYNNSPINYPPVSITLISIISNISGLSVHRSYFLYALLISFILPFVSYRLSRVLNLDKKTSIFFACLISLYGGFFSESLKILPYVYTIAPQIVLHFVARNLNLLVFLIFLTLWFKMLNEEQKSFIKPVVLGIIVGLMGLIHPQAYIIGMAYLSFLLISDFLKRQNYQYYSLSLLIALGVSFLFWGEILYDIIGVYGGLNTQFSLSPEIYPTKAFEFIMLYGPLPILAIASFGIKREKEAWKLVSLISIFTLIIYRIVLSFLFPNKEMFILRINRFGTLIFVFLALLACGGIDRLLKKKKILIISLMVVTVFISYISTFRYFGKFYKKEPARFINLLSSNFIPDGIHEWERLRHIVPDPKKTIMVPAYWTQKVAWETGLDVPWVNRSRIAFKEFFDKTLSQGERYDNVQTFYQELSKNVLREDILRRFEAECFVADQRYLEKKFQVTFLGELEIPRKHAENEQKMKIWYLYTIKNK